MVALFETRTLDKFKKKRLIYMVPISNMTVALNAEASVLMEGLFVTDEHKKLCQKYLSGQITLSECLKKINSKYIKE